MRIYLDNCSYNRPYDDLSHLTVSLEAQAKLFIQEKIFDYTKWQREHYDAITPEELDRALEQYSTVHPFQGKKAQII